MSLIRGLIEIFYQSLMIVAQSGRATRIPRRRAKLQIRNAGAQFVVNFPQCVALQSLIPRLVPIGRVHRHACCMDFARRQPHFKSHGSLVDWYVAHEIFCPDGRTQPNSATVPRQATPGFCQRYKVSHRPQAGEPLHRSDNNESLLAGDDVIGDLIAWRDAGRRGALVSLVSIDGATPRPLGAQMAVAEGGHFTGYLSGGCIEQSVAEEAGRAIAEGRNRLVRYGKGSAYFDIKLPCGSGLDLYIDQGLPATVIASAAAHRRARRAYVHVTDLDSGVSTIAPLHAGEATRLVDGRFHRAHLPLPRVVLVGGGPALGAIASLVAAIGFAIDVVTPDDAARATLTGMGLPVRALTDPNSAGLSNLDCWTAAIVAFHEHDWEAPVLAEILRTPSFYVGVMGSKNAHANRLARLAQLGVPAELQKRLRSPIGLIPGARSRSTLAVGIVAELVAEAKASGMLA